MTESCIHGAWNKLCPELAVDFGGFDLSERLSEECLKCLELARKVGLDELDEEDVDSARDNRRGARQTEEVAASVGGGSGG